MKAYNKPEFYVAEFRMNDVVAVCTALEEGVAYKATEVKCLKTSSDMIFTAGTSGCDHAVNPKEDGTGYAWYDDTTEGNDIPDGLYFGWVGFAGQSSQDGSNSANETLFEKLKDIFEDLLTPSKKQVIHIGPANNYLTQLYSHS